MGCSELGYTMADLAERQEIRTRPSLERKHMECEPRRRFSLYWFCWVLWIWSYPSRLSEWSSSVFSCRNLPGLNNSYARYTVDHERQILNKAPWVSGPFDLIFYQTNWRENLRAYQNPRVLAPDNFRSPYTCIIPCLAHIHSFYLKSALMNIFFTFFLISAIIVQSYRHTSFILLVILNIFILVGVFAGHLIIGLGLGTGFRRLL